VIWLFLGLVLGYVMGANKQSASTPKELEKCTVERNQQETDIVYYKKITRTLVDENKELRKQINAS
jgi:hypothetical protein